MSRDRFTVEPVGYEGYGIGEYAIRYTPEEKKNEDGSTSIGLSFHALIAGDCLGNQQETLQQVADVLNASEIGK